jgi:hypothetical protein
MPATRRQKRANRKNAEKSTGPNTVEGKQVSSQNAITHGLHARSVVIDSKHFHEDPDEYRALLQSLHETFQPEGKFEEYLVGKIANALWRCNRAAAAETACVSRSIDRADRETASHISLAMALTDDPEIDDDPESDYFRTRLQQTVAAHLVPGQNVSANILRYEMRLDRQLARAYYILTRHQDRRRKQANSQWAEAGEITEPVTEAAIDAETLPPDFPEDDQVVIIQ